MTGRMKAKANEVFDDDAFIDYLLEGEHLTVEGVAATRVTYPSGGKDLFADGCRTCDEEKAVGQVHAFPRHWASSRCQSGKRAHCTCDCCW